MSGTIKINLIEIVNILYRIYIIFSKIIYGYWLKMQQFFDDNFPVKMMSVDSKKRQHRDLGLNKHIKWSLSVLLYHSVRNEPNNPPYFKIFKFKFYWTSKSKSTMRTWSIAIQVRSKRWAYLFCAILRSMRFPDKIFRFPTGIFNLQIISRKISCIFRTFSRF